MKPILSSPILHTDDFYKRRWVDRFDSPWFCADVFSDILEIPKDVLIRVHLYKKCTDEEFQIPIQLIFSDELIWREIDATPLKPWKPFYSRVTKFVEKNLKNLE